MAATIGIVGSGAVGRALAAHVIASGRDVVLCNSRGPATLELLVKELGPRVSALETSAVAAADREGGQGFCTLPASALALPPATVAGRRVMFLSGDDEDARTAVGALIDDIGYAAVDLGSLSTGSTLQQPGGPLAGRDLRLAADGVGE